MNASDEKAYDAVYRKSNILDYCAASKGAVRSERLTWGTWEDQIGGMFYTLTVIAVLLINLALWSFIGFVFSLFIAATLGTIALSYMGAKLVSLASKARYDAARKIVAENPLALALTTEMTEALIKSMRLADWQCETPVRGKVFMFGEPRHHQRIERRLRHMDLLITRGDGMGWNYYYMVFDDSLDRVMFRLAN